DCADHPGAVGDRGQLVLGADAEPAVGAHPRRELLRVDPVGVRRVLDSAPQRGARTGRAGVGAALPPHLAGLRSRVRGDGALGGASRLDLLCPWPLYLLVAAVLIGVVWALMPLPWVLLDRRAGTPELDGSALVRRPPAVLSPAAPPRPAAAVPRNP